MVGLPFEEKVAEQRALIDDILARSPGAATKRGLAIDLGAGPGFQTLALAELEFSPVLAIDTSAALLNQLQTRAAQYQIEAKLADLTDFQNDSDSRRANLIVCMGDTLTYLPSKEAVSTLFAAVARRLSQDGIFIITYRDLTTLLSDTDRFILFAVRKARS